MKDRIKRRTRSRDKGPDKVKIRWTWSRKEGPDDWKRTKSREEGPD